MLNTSWHVRDLFQRNFPRRITFILLLIGMCMTYQEVGATKLVSNPIVFKDIQIDELLLTVLDEYKKFGFSYKKSTRHENPYAVVLVIQFDYLPKVTKDYDGDVVAEIAIVSDILQKGLVIYKLEHQGIGFRDPFVFKNEADVVSKNNVYRNFDLSRASVKEKLKKFLVPSANN